MRRRAAGLKVDTFPFLAVLLCAMGSLILLLLVLDRRAKLVVLAKAQAAAEQVVQEEEQAAAARRAEWERRQQALHARLAEEEEGVRAELQAVVRKREQVASELAAQQAHTAELAGQLRVEETHLREGQEALRTRQEGFAAADQRAEASRAELARLSAELARLEQTVADLKALRRRQEQTYSLVPYKGKHGDNRRPLYVECTAGGLVFHPDRKALEGPGVTAAEVRAEVEHRIAAQLAALPEAERKPESAAYLLLLIRPDGIVTYYKTLVALNGIKLDFGYEFIDAGWVLNFPTDDNATPAQPWQVAAQSGPTPPSPGGKTARPGRRVVGANFGASPGGADVSDPGSAGGEGSANLGTPTPLGGHPIASSGGAGPPTGRPVAATTALPSGVPGNDVAGSDPPARGTPGVGSAPFGPAGDAGVGTDSPGGVGGSGALAGANAGGPIPPIPLSPALTTREPFQMSVGGGEGSGVRGSSGAGDGTSPLTPDPSPPPARFSPDVGPSRRGRGEPRAGPQGFSQPPLASTGNPGGPPGAALSPAGPLTPSPSPPPTGFSTDAGPSGRGRGEPEAGAQGLSQPLLAPTGNPGGPPGTAPSPLPPSEPPATASPGGGSSPGGTPSLLPMPVPTAAKGRSSAPGAAQPDSPGETEPAPTGLPNPLARVLGNDPNNKLRPAPARPRPLFGNHDWVINIDCQVDAVVLLPTGARIATTALAPGTTDKNPLREAVERLVARRQATVRPGEPPYRPQVRFLVRPDGLRTYYLAYPALEPLRLPMTRENVESRDDQKAH
jgi:hypothetical protein